MQIILNEIKNFFTTEEKYNTLNDAIQHKRWDYFYQKENFFIGLSKIQNFRFFSKWISNKKQSYHTFNQQPQPVFWKILKCLWRIWTINKKTTIKFWITFSSEKQKERLGKSSKVLLPIMKNSFLIFLP